MGKEYIKPCKLCGEDHSIIRGDFNLYETCSFLKQQLAIAKQKVSYFRIKAANAENKVSKLELELADRRGKRDD